ncbi:MAG: hypothetical protein OEY93_11490 [Anaerolineae bacterium]|nr:hypothetical protein [Anaerolineae bacterium]
MDGEWTGLIEALAANPWRPDGSQEGRCGGAAGSGTQAGIESLYHYYDAKGK